MSHDEQGGARLERKCVATHGCSYWAAAQQGARDVALRSVPCDTPPRLGSSMHFVTVSAEAKHIAFMTF